MTEHPDEDQEHDCARLGHLRADDGDGFWHCAACASGKYRPVKLPPAWPQQRRRRIGFGPWLLLVCIAIIAAILLASLLDGCSWRIGASC